MSNTPSHAIRRLAPLLAIGLGVMAALYTANGMRRLLTDVPGSFPIDLRLRWTEEHLVLAGRNPQVVGHPDPMITETHAVMRKAGGGYPAWSYSLGLVLVPPMAWQLTRVYFAALCFISLAASGWIGFRRARSFGPWEATVAAILPFANFSAAICTSYGQYAVLLAGLQLGVVELTRARKPVGAGALLGLAMVKPQLTAPLLLGLAVTRHARVVATALAVLLLATLVTYALLDDSLTSLAVRSGRQLGFNYRMSHNPLLAPLCELLGFRIAVPLLMAASAILLAMAAWRLRSPESMLDLASVAAIVAMFWTYRRNYDVALMSLPLLALWLRALQTPRRASLIMFLLVGASLWLPIRDVQWQWPIVRFGHLALWTSAAGWLLLSERRSLATTTPVLGHGHDAAVAPS